MALIPSQAAQYDWSVLQVSNLQNGQFRKELTNQVDRPMQGLSLGPSLTVLLPLGWFKQDSPELVVQVSSVGTYHVSVVIRDVASSTLLNETTTFFCRYVRKNIRHLSDFDRTMFFDTFAVLMEVNTFSGQPQFGDNYYGLDHFVETHLSRAGGRTVDHMHDGLGFLTQHVAITNEFELALQSVEPRLTVPYWDFAEDKYLALQSDDPNTAIWGLDIWDSDWFGTAEGAEHTVKAGRWAWQQVSKGSSNASYPINAFGFLRAPWNVNKSPYLTRVHKFCGEYLEVSEHWPSCENHYDWTFADDYDTLYDYLWAAPYAPHATIHSMIGGYTNCGNITEELEAQGIEMPTLGRSMAKFRLDTLVFVKNMYRYGLAEAPEYCSMDTPQEDCHLVCTDKINNETFIHEVLTHSHTTWFGTWISSLPSTFKPAVMRVLCNTPWSPGEQMEAASPADVSFWPIHPTLERLFQYRRMVKGFSSSKWENENGTTSFCIYSSASNCEGHHSM